MQDPSSQAPYEDLQPNAGLIYILASFNIDVEEGRSKRGTRPLRFGPCRVMSNHFSNTVIPAGSA